MYVYISGLRISQRFSEAKPIMLGIGDSHFEMVDIEFVETYCLRQLRGAMLGSSPPGIH